MFSSIMLADSFSQMVVVCGFKFLIGFLEFEASMVLDQVKLFLCGSQIPKDTENGVAVLYSYG